jgi:hypothetical protein
MRRTRTGIALTLAAAGLLAAVAPVAAAAPVEFTIDDSITVDHACGIVEQTRLTGSGRAYFDAEGNWLRDVINFTSVGTFTNPDSGAVYQGRSHQNLVATPDAVAIAGQGIFLRGPGGVVNYDVGRLVFDPADGSTLAATPKVLSFDDAEGYDALEAALCAALG